jgi:DNA repair ATPase RecN
MQQRGKKMEEYQERVIKEKENLDIKIGDLREFMTGPKGFRVLREEYKRLCRQEMIMQLYSEVLQDRIEAFPKVFALREKKTPE